MRINPINYNNYDCRKQNPSFSAYATMACKNDKLLYKTETGFFRGDLLWDNFLNYILRKFTNTEDKVNIVNHACSAGYETYSLLIMLMNKLSRHDYQRFFPIIARDIDAGAIKYAKQGVFQAGSPELRLLNQYGEDTFDNNFQVESLENPRNLSWATGNLSWYNKYKITCNENIRQYIDFAESDIYNDKDLISKKNTILLCRNFWPYLGEEKCCKLAGFLAENIGENSSVVIGDFDCAFDIDLLLEAKGFKNVLGLEHHVFEAPKKKSSIRQ